MSGALRQGAISDRQLLELILEKLTSLETVLGRLATDANKPKLVSRADRDRLSRLLPAIAGVFGSDEFSARQIMEHRSPALEIVRDGLTTKALGRLLKRSAGKPVDGYMVELYAEEAGVWLYQVLEVPDFPHLQKPSVTGDREFDERTSTRRFEK